MHRIFQSGALRLAACAAVAVAVVVVTALLEVPHPFLWMWLVTIPLLLITAVRATDPRVKSAGLVLFGFALSIAALEIAFTTYGNRLADDATKMAGTYGRRGYYRDDPDFGYRVKPGARVTSRKMSGRRVIYDVSYNFGSDGRRLTPGNPRGETWVFMGCSFTFGEGVSDAETLPARFSAELGDSANVVNLAFHGYGAHQMLRALETGRLPGVHEPVRQVIYQGTPFHVRRSVGRAIWDSYGPEYELHSSTVRYVGPFHGKAFGRVIQLLSRSHLADYFMKRLYFNDNVDDSNIELYARIVDRAAQIARRDLDAGFTILFWDDTTDVGRRVLARLRQTGIPIVLVSEIIPADEKRNMVFPDDGHPTPDTNRRLASALARRFHSVHPPVGL